MPSISETTTILSPPGDVWPLLSDPALVAACIPGATLLPDRDGDAWKGSIRVKFGPTVAVFRGEATLTYDHTAMTCTIAGRGIDQRGASRALANGVVTASGDATTTLLVNGDYNVTGPLETFANAGGVHVARALLAEFSANMAKMVAERRAAAGTGSSPNEATVILRPIPSTPDSVTVINPGSLSPRGPAAVSQPDAQPPRMARELSAGKLLWSAFLSWLRSLLGKRT